MKEKFRKYLNEDFQFDKPTWLGIFCLIIVIAGMFGWLYEVVFYFFNSGMKEVFWRGGNFSPWINIYAIGAVAIFFFILLPPGYQLISLRIRHDSVSDFSSRYGDYSPYPYTKPYVRY